MIELTDALMAIAKAMDHLHVQWILPFVWQIGLLKVIVVVLYVARSEPNLFDVEDGRLLEVL